MTSWRVRAIPMSKAEVADPPSLLVGGDDVA